MARKGPRRSFRYGRSQVGNGAVIHHVTDAGEDEPLSARGQWIWGGVLIGLALAFGVLLVMSVRGG